MYRRWWTLLLFLFRLLMKWLIDNSLLCPVFFHMLLFQLVSNLSLLLCLDFLCLFVLFGNWVHVPDLKPNQPSAMVKPTTQSLKYSSFTRVLTVLCLGVTPGYLFTSSHCVIPVLHISFSNAYCFTRMVKNSLDCILLLKALPLPLSLFY